MIGQVHNNSMPWRTGMDGNRAEFYNASTAPLSRSGHDIDIDMNAGELL